MMPVSTKEAAQKLGVTVHRVRQLIAENRLKAVKFGRDWLIEPGSLKAFKPERRGPKPKKR